jgi:hypothetical protein
LSNFATCVIDPNGKTSSKNPIKISNKLTCNHFKNSLYTKQPKYTQKIEQEILRNLKKISKHRKDNHEAGLP